MHDSMPLKGILKNWWHRSLVGKEKFIPGNPTETSVTTKERQSWLQISYMKYAYHTMSPKFTLGWMAEMLYSSKNFRRIIQPCCRRQFFSLPLLIVSWCIMKHSGPNQFLAAGIKPILFSMICSNSVLNFMVSYRYFLLKRMHWTKLYYGKAFFALWIYRRNFCNMPIALWSNICICKSL